MPIEAVPGRSWTSCPPDPLVWISWRECLLHVLQTPALLLPAVALLVLTAVLSLRRQRFLALALALLSSLLVSAIYSPAATAALSAWLHRQLPPADPSAAGVPPVLVIPGRGPQIAVATTTAAALVQHRQAVAAVYVSGDQRATADRLVQLGVPPALVFGDDCARTTWENATRTADWLRRHHPQAAVMLISDPWHLPRASRAFQREGLRVIPLAAAPRLAARALNHLALRETAATLLYAVQQRVLLF